MIRLKVVAALAALMLALLPGRLAAQGFGVDHEAEYTACMSLTVSDPAQAIASAGAWSAEGGGNPAAHCRAVALIGLGEYSQAAEELEQLAAVLEPAYAALEADVLGQAAQAWFIAGELEKALARQDAALALTPDAVELLVDRAITQASLGLFWEAVDDLNRASDLAPQRADLLVFRASAYRQLEAHELALEDVERALTLKPDDPVALLERGNLYRLTGQDAAARDDWIRILALAPRSLAAEDARSNLESLDVDSGD